MFSGGGIHFKCENFLDKYFGKFDVVISIDVIEHIRGNKEKQFLMTIFKNLSKNGFCIIGTPNITASKYASKESQKGHVNLYSAERLKTTLQRIFTTVFIFGMNDEVIHTGFYDMCHYLFAVGVNRKNKFI